jgi:RNA-directed DNA polymerase
MITKMTELSFDIKKIDVEAMSNEIFGISYNSLKKIIYPQPHYKTFLIAKRNGEFRVINEPRLNLKQLQSKLLNYLYTNHPRFKPCVHGFVPSKSILTNAAQHSSFRTNYLLNIDISNFFPSITFYRVRGLFMSNPFGFSYAVATVLAQVCCYKNSLPQGAPTSPIIANLVCRKLDSQLMELAKAARAVYTRYSDDLSFSLSIRDYARLPKSLCVFDGVTLTLGNELVKVIQDNSFEINQNKSRISNKSQRLEVTGLTINEFPNVKRKFIDEIRGALHAWEVYGYELAESEFQSTRYKRSTRSGIKPSLRRYLKGKLLFLKMVRGEEDLIYTKLAEKFNQLYREAFSIEFEVLPIRMVVKNQQDAEKATFVVLCDSAKAVLFSQGTAFSISETEFITCEHVIKAEGRYFDDIQDGKIKIEDSMTKRRWLVRVAHRDAELDLALLEVIGTEKPDCRHFSLSNSVIKNGQTGIVLGFPNHSAGRSLPIHLSAQVLSKFNRTQLERLDISELIRTGNSGGPFVDTNYNLLGVAQQGATQDGGNNECLSVIELKKWLETYRHHKLQESSRLEKIAILRDILKMIAARL